VALREAEALVLRVYDYGDTSQVAHLLVAGAGRIHVLAKGSRREKNAFQGPLDLLVRGRAAWYPRPRTGLHLLGSFEVLETFPRIRGDLERYYLACHVLEALHETARQEEPGETAYLLGTAACRMIERADRPENVLPPFHADLLRQLGSAPRLDVCVSCETPAAEVRRPRLSPASGGLLCETCAVEDRFAVSIRPEVLGELDRLLSAPFREGVRGPVPEPLLRPVVSALTLLLRSVLERDLPTLRTVLQ
jgi:DNA repair protein RecO (recombination protein O)